MSGGIRGEVVHGWAVLGGPAVVTGKIVLINI